MTTGGRDYFWCVGATGRENKGLPLLWCIALSKRRITPKSYKKQGEQWCQLWDGRDNDRQFTSTLSSSTNFTTLARYHMPSSVNWATQGRPGNTDVPFTGAADRSSPLPYFSNRLPMMFINVRSPGTTDDQQIRWNNLHSEGKGHTVLTKAYLTHSQPNKRGKNWSNTRCDLGWNVEGKRYVHFWPDAV